MSITRTELKRRLVWLTNIDHGLICPRCGARTTNPAQLKLSTGEELHQCGNGTATTGGCGEWILSPIRDIKGLESEQDESY